MEEDVTFKILDRGVKVSRSEILRRLKRANLMRYGYKREISTDRRIENNKSEFKVSPAIFFSPKRFIALSPLIQIKFNFARLLLYYQGFVLFHVSVVRNVVMLKMKLYF